jgi:K(+)-stimulated pyrophosphate-energized sodium pump
MQEIAGAIQEGAMAYLKRQFRTIALILIPLVVVVFLTSTVVLKPDGSEALSLFESGSARTLAFIAGCVMSGLTGFIGMRLAVQGNVRTAAAARSGSLPAALQIAFRTGGVAGMFTVGLGLLGATVIIMIFQNTSSAILIGFGFGGSLLALFMRVGGGIFTKAADVGADLVGKIEQGIPEDDARNPARVTKPDLQGLDKANPTSMILSVAMLLSWLGSVPGCQAFLVRGQCHRRGGRPCAGLASHET